MWDSAQSGSNSQPTNPGTEIPAGQIPGDQASAPEDKKEEIVEPDYKSFFEEGMASRRNEMNTIEAKLADDKVSREEKITLRERRLDLREEMAKYGNNKSPSQAPDISFVPVEKQAFLNETLSKVTDPSDRAAIIDFAKQLFAGVGGAPAKDTPNPANLDKSKDGIAPGGTAVKLSSANLLGVDVDKETVDNTRAAFWNFLGGLK